MRSTYKHNNLTHLAHLAVVILPAGSCKSRAQNPTAHSHHAPLSDYSRVRVEEFRQSGLLKTSIYVFLTIPNNDKEYMFHRPSEEAEDRTDKE